MSILIKMYPLPLPWGSTSAWWGLHVHWGAMNGYFTVSIDEILNIRHTKDTQTFRKPCLVSEQDSGFMSLPVDNFKTTETPEELRPIQGNQTIIEGK